MHRVPAIRVRSCNARSLRASADYVLYWMIANRRLTHNFALDRALEYCRELRKPLLILEALRCDYPWASARLHRFVADGMADNAASSSKRGVCYYPYVEDSRGAGRGLLEALAAHAATVVTDDYPCFFLPRMVAAAAKRLPVRLEAVDSNGLLPLRAAKQVFSTAHSFRRFLHNNLPLHLQAFPNALPFTGAHLPPAPRPANHIAKRWPPASEALLSGRQPLPRSAPIDRAVAPCQIRGGPSPARKRLREFLDHRFLKYHEDRNEPDLDVASGLSPYLHFGQ